MRTKITLLLIGAAILTGVNAKGIKEFQDKLEFEGSGGYGSGEVTIREDNSARIALAELSSREKKSTIDGFRIGVFFDNGASARSNAMSVKKQCEKYFSDIPITMTYDNPYFKVSAGYCINSEEAIIMLNRIQRHFPKAYIMREKISVEELKIARDKEKSSYVNNNIVED